MTDHPTPNPSSVSVSEKPPTEEGKVLACFKRPVAWLFLGFLLLAAWLGQSLSPTWVSEKVTLDMQQDAEGRLFFLQRGAPVFVEELVAYEASELHPQSLETISREGGKPTLNSQIVLEVMPAGQGTLYYQLNAKRHWGFWSLLPALVAVTLCWVTREPVTALFSGILVGALLLGVYDLTDGVLVPSLATTSAAGILILYLWLLGGLMGIWSKTGAAQAFAELMTRKVVRGPRTAKLVAWMVGVIFFQGGTVSTVLCGTTVKPIADKENISHEELAYIVDSTASPIASILAFNAWPGYVQAFLYVAGVGWLATEADRVAFFFKSIPFSFYAIFAVLGTFLLSIDKAPWLGKRMKDAVKRSRETGRLDADGAMPLSAPELLESQVPKGYRPHFVDFVLPLAVLIGIAVGTFITSGSPQVRWAFGAALLLAMFQAMARGMSLTDVMAGLNNGLKGVVLGSVILLLAVTLGGISKQAGGGVFLVALLGESLPFWLLPFLLLILTIAISFSTGTSWGTYAVAFPLAMPLSWAVAQAQGLENPQFFMMMCFSAVMNGSVFGDQCSPISDTTVLSSMCTGCDLMDHVKTQFPPAALAAFLAGTCWTLMVLLFA